MNGSSAWFELFLVAALIVANGFFSAAEIAIVSVRKSRLAQLIAEERHIAKVVAALKDDPSRFLATVQIGVTLVGSMASVVGGAASVHSFTPILRDALPVAAQGWAEPIALTLTVTLISYFTLVIGELVPKSLGLRHSERLSLVAARPIDGLSRLAAPLVRLLTLSTDGILWLFGQRTTSQESFTSEEEVKHMVHEGARHGIFDEAERQLIHSVFAFTDTSVRDVLVPRSEVHAIESSTALPDILRELVQTGFSRMPVYEGDLDHVVGIVHIKEVLREVDKDEPGPLSAIMHPAYFVPDSMQISDLLRELQTRRTHMAVVVNEFGTVVGVVTIEDLLEEIVGEIRDEFDVDEEQAVQELPDGSLLVQGSFLISDLSERYGIPLEEGPDYRTVAGFILARLKRFPKGGEAIREGEYKMTVVVLDGRRLRKIRIEGPFTRRTQNAPT